MASRPPSPHPPAQAVRPRLLTPALALLFVATFGAMTSFQLLIPVVPLYAEATGAGEFGAGATTAALLATTVAAELVTPWLTARAGPRLVFAAGLVLLGAPVLALPAAHHLAAILAVCLVRGLGFGIVVVLASALVAELVPPQRRGEGLGLHGISVGLPGVVALPFGVYLVDLVGYPPVFLVGAVAALAGLAAVPGLPGRRHRSRQPGQTGGGLWSALRTPALVWPALVFAAAATASGIVLTFLPLAAPGEGGTLAAAALLGYAVTSTGFRWWAGRYGDRHGPGRLILPSVLVAAVGMLLLGWVSNPVVLLVAMPLFGIGFGISQNASLALMFNRSPVQGYGGASALWNIAYDGAMGVGAMGFGAVVGLTGYPLGFLLTGGLILLALPLARRA